jgi:hypothetical protein
MTASMNTEPRRPLRTADLASAGTASPAQEAQEEREPESELRGGKATAETERLEALFPADVAAQFRTRWSEVQSGFVDDPRRAVAEGDELVAEVMKSLAESFAHERRRLEDELTNTGEASTETLRVGLRRYRSFFERLLSL